MWDVLVLTGLEEGRGRRRGVVVVGGVCCGALNAGLLDQRPAGERAGYRGKNNTHTIASSRHQRARSREEEIESKGSVCVCVVVVGAREKEGRESRIFQLKQFPPPTGLLYGFTRACHSRGDRALL